MITNYSIHVNRHILYQLMVNPNYTGLDIKNLILYRSELIGEGGFPNKDVSLILKRNYKYINNSDKLCDCGVQLNDIIYARPLRI